MNPYQNRQARNKEIDYDYEEELRKYQELLDSNTPQKETSRVGEEQNKIQTQSDTLKEALKILTQNFTSGKVYQSQQQQQLVTPNSNPLQPTSGQQMILNHQGYQQNPQGYPQGYVQQQSVPQIQNYDQQQPAQVQNYNQQQPAQVQSYNQQQSAQVPSYNQQQPAQVQNYDQQQYYPQESNYAAIQTYPQQLPQPQATDRSGQYEPVGIRLNFGGGRGLLGGNLSPLGIIGSILRPLLPRAQANLNGKVMFGVMLEKGVKLGAGKGGSYG